MFKELLAAFAVSIIIASPSFAMAKEGCGGACNVCHTLTRKRSR